MDNKKPRIAALIVAAGTGERFGGALPKQYLPLLGRPVLRWSIDTFLQCPEISDICVVIHPDQRELYAQATSGLPLPPPVIGGASRQDSVIKGLEALAALKPDGVLIHDAARPGLTPVLVTQICASLRTNDAVIPGLPVTDTIRRVTPSGTATESRDGLYTIQTPQAFKFDLILDLHHKHKSAVTDDAALCELAGQKVTITPGDRGNFKITHGDDLALMEQTIAHRCADVRTGSGYDVHRLVDPSSTHRKLLLGGVEIAHDKVLEGHSDADVALHALTDALLGTICDGDIGMHFSPKDSRWKGANSAAFLQHAGSLISAQGGLITHVDVTIICEAPKIGPHRDEIRARIGEILNLPVSRVSVKATTTEGLGFTGRGEGIAAEAVATIRLPFARAHSTAAETTRKWGT